MMTVGVITKLPFLVIFLVGIIDFTTAQRRPSLESRPSISRPRRYCYSLCPVGWTKWNNHCYKYVKSRVTGDAAESACVAQGGHLASINNLVEQNFVYNLWQTGGVGPSDSINVTPQNALWIGAKKVGSTWTWSDGSLWNPSWDHWDNNYNQPDNTGNCAHMWTLRTSPTGGWNDLYCNSNSYRTYYVCERNSHSCCYPFVPEWPQ